MQVFDIEPIDFFKQKSYQHKIDTKTKPLGSLGILEKLALQICLIQKTEYPKLTNPHIIVFAADHGIANEGVSPFPQTVTGQMVQNFWNGGAAINVFSKNNNIGLTIIDAGVNWENNASEWAINKGTKNFLYEPAMTEIELHQAIKNGAKIAENQIIKNNSNVLGFGEMGISNTSSAAILMHIYTGIILEKCVGKGTGLNENGVKNKVEILKKCMNTSHGNETKQNQNPYLALQYFGGFEIAMMCGAMLKTAEKKAIILVDGFIATAAFMAAYFINPLIKEYAIFCHQSDENGHKFMLEYLEVEPVLKLNMRLGEGSGCAVAYPIIASAVHFMNDMASFDSAKVDTINT